MGFDAMDPFHNFLKDGVLAFAEAAWEFVKGAFQAGAMTQEWWAAVVGGQVTVIVGSESTVIDHPGMLNVVTLAMVPLLLILVAIQVVVSMIRGSTAGLLRALTVGVFAIPSIYVLTGLVWLVVAGVDALTQGILNVGSDGSEDALRDIVALFGMTVDSSTGDVMLDTNYEHWAIMDDEGAAGKTILSFLIAVVVFLCGFMLELMMIFRLVAIIVLAIFMPVAVYGLASEAAKAMMSRWASLVVALIIAKPAAAVILKTGLTLGSLGSSWVQLVVGVVLILAAALAPILTLTFIAFITAGASDTMERAAIAGAISTVGAAKTLQRGIGGAARTGSRAVGGGVRGGKKLVGAMAGGNSKGNAANASSPRIPTNISTQSSSPRPMKSSGAQQQSQPKQNTPKESGTDSGAQSSSSAAKQHQSPRGSAGDGSRSSGGAAQQSPPSDPGSGRGQQKSGGSSGGGSARRSRRGEEI